MYFVLARKNIRTFGKYYLNCEARQKNEGTIKPVSPISHFHSKCLSFTNKLTVYLDEIITFKPNMKK